MIMIFNSNKYLDRYTSSSTLAVYRFFFGLLMCFSLVRFISKGWVEKLYISPDFHFSYYLFEWIKPLGDYTYILFLICFLSSFFVCIGFKYRISIIVFFLSFSYIELMDKTTYLNHYYFISVISFLLIFLPANASFSIDNLISGKSYKKIPQWTIDCLKLMIVIVYFYAGLAKLNSDWLFEAMPLKIWLSARYHFPLVGETFFQQEWFYYFMSWAGVMYDLTIPFLLLYTRTRFFAFVMVIIFHLLTKILFPIGMFPYIMIFSAIIFFSPNTQDRILKKIQSIVNQIIKVIKLNHKLILKNTLKDVFYYKNQKIIIYCFALFFIIQLLLPFRYILYPGELFWHEQGYRFSWRVMLTEKTGWASFKIMNPTDGTYSYVDNSDFLTPFQEKQMSFQPDFILEYAHYLGDHFTAKNNTVVQVFVDNYVSLNGRKSQRLVSDTVNLYAQKESFKHKTWILPLNDEITGF